MMELSKIFALGVRLSAKLGSLAFFACLISSLDALAQPINRAPPLGTNAPLVQRAPAPAIRPTNRTRKRVRSAPAPRKLNPVAGAPLLRTAPPRTDRTNFSAAKHPSGVVVPRDRPRAVAREVARRITVAGGVLVLPEVAYFGVPVILDVPDVGVVEVSEDKYARLYRQLISSDQEQVDVAIASLRAIKAIEDAEVEAVRRGPESSGRERDLSEPMSFGRPSKIIEPSRRLY
jgi:hypothetical protein